MPKRKERQMKTRPSWASNIDPGPRWVDVATLSPAGKLLTRIEPGQRITLDGQKYKVAVVQLEPPKLILVRPDGKRICATVAEEEGKQQ
jgi:hypothetical protein